VELEGRVVGLNKDNIEIFKVFCRKYRNLVDDSFLYEEDLRQLIINSKNPTYLYIEEENVVAAVSLIVDEYYKRSKKARFRIFYSEKNDIKIYYSLLGSILVHTKSLEKIYIFVPTTNENLMRMIESIGFYKDRYVSLMIREGNNIVTEELSEGYSIKEFNPNEDAKDWCIIRNLSFSTVKGNETPISTTMLLESLENEDYIPDGMIMLKYNDLPIGIVKCSKDVYEDEPIINIGPLGIHPDYQKKGLGKALLREAIKLANDKGYNKCILSVNADNENAKKIYKNEGFKEVEGAICYEYILKKSSE